jgi:hypothetical protein
MHGRVDRRERRAIVEPVAVLSHVRVRHARLGMPAERDRGPRRDGVGERRDGVAERDVEHDDAAVGVHGRARGRGLVDHERGGEHVLLCARRGGRLHGGQDGEPKRERAGKCARARKDEHR